jgi:hypothetical protein
MENRPRIRVSGYLIGQSGAGISHYPTGARSPRERMDFWRLCFDPVSRRAMTRVHEAFLVYQAIVDLRQPRIPFGPKGDERTCNCVMIAPVSIEKQAEWCCLLPVWHVETDALASLDKSLQYSFSTLFASLAKSAMERSVPVSVLYP